MNAGGDTADQMVRMTLQGIEVAGNIALRAGGMATQSLAATLYAILTDKKKVRGKTRLNAMLRSGKELKVFAIRHQDLEVFCKEAKHYGVLYSILKEKNNTDGICDIMVRAEDAAKISRIVDKYELATINTKAMRESILAERNKSTDTRESQGKVLTEEEHDELVERLMRSTVDPQSTDAHPLQARTEKTSDNQFEHNLKKVSVAENSQTTSKRPSVRQELNEIKAKQKASKSKDSKQNSKEFNFKSPNKVKKGKVH